MAKHPEHAALTGPLYLQPAKPLRGSWLVQAQAERNCIDRGGHWWHPDEEGMIEWYCCQCGAETEGLPEDGTGSRRIIALLVAIVLDKVRRTRARRRQ